MQSVKKLAILGTGMIGGSIGLSAMKRRVVDRIIGYDNNSFNLQTALEKGICHAIEADLAKAVKDADLVICCAPVHLITQVLQSAAPYCKVGAVLSDVGSTKGAIANTFPQKEKTSFTFIPGHPIAGSEKNGPQAATDNLFEGRLFISTPAANVAQESINILEDFWGRIGARVARLAPEEHDRIFALTSHLPHMIAYALAGLLDPHLAKFTGGGFRDTTRVAGSDPVLWTEILRANRGPLLDSLKPFLAQLNKIQQSLEQDNREETLRLLTEANRCRQQIS